MSTIRTISPSELAGQPSEALLIDVREPGEFAGERLPGSVKMPLTRLEAETEGLPRDRKLLILCRSGRRSEYAARRLATMGFRDVNVVGGGLACCPGLEKGPGGAWAMERQVRMAAGSLVPLGLVLSWTLDPWFALLSAGIGAGLVDSAATDTCGMAMVLARMPWNKARR